MALGNVHLTPQLIQAVRDGVDVLDVAESLTRLEKRGDRYWGLCPFHKEKTPSFSVDPLRGLYYCFGCGAGGDAIRLHMQSTGDDFPQAIEALARLQGIPLPSPLRGAQRDEARTEAVLEAATELFQEQLRSSAKARQYLRERRIPDAVVERFRVGYAPDSFDCLTGTLQRRFRLADLEEAGVVSVRQEGGRNRVWDRFRDRLIFPVFNSAGRLVGFGGRTLGDDRAKYINTKETERFRKRYLLYGLDKARRAVRERGTMVLVEGYFDALALVASGVEWVAATMGTALSPEQARLCARYADQVVVAYDGDEAGEAAARRALPLLLARGLGVRRLGLGEGQDPDSLRLERGEEALRACVDEAVDAVELELERVLPPLTSTDPQERARAAEQVRELLTPIPDPVLRFAYGRRAAERLGIPGEVLWQAGRSSSRERRSQRQRSEAARSQAEQGADPERREVVSLEERVLQLLLSGEARPPAPDGLPPGDAFLDPTCGNIYRRFLAMYMEGGSAPDSRELMAALSSGGESLDQVARILLQTSTCSGEPGELEDCLRVLTRRWLKRRLGVLAKEIQEAQRKGEDDARLEALIEQRRQLNSTFYQLAPEPQAPTAE